MYDCDDVSSEDVVGLELELSGVESDELELGGTEYEDELELVLPLELELELPLETELLLRACY